MDKELYSTRDLGEASALVTKGHPVVTIDFEYDKNSVIGYFFFDDTEELRETIKECLQGKTMVEFRQFLSNLRSLKSQVSNRERARSLNG